MTKQNGNVICSPDKAEFQIFDVQISRVGQHIVNINIIVCLGEKSQNIYPTHQFSSEFGSTYTILCKKDMVSVVWHMVSLKNDGTIAIFGKN